MARCKYHNYISELVTSLPLLIVNSTFRSLSSMQDKELEEFLRYLVRFSSQAEEWDQDIKPIWWDDNLEFPWHFCSKNAEIPFVKNKLDKMREIITQCYLHYNQFDLILLSERLADNGPYYFQENLNSTVTVYSATKRAPLVVIPKSNLEYEMPVVKCSLLNVGLKRCFKKSPGRKTLLKSAELESEDDEDYIELDQSQYSSNKTPSSSTTRAVPRKFQPIKKSSCGSSEDDEDVSNRPITPKVSTVVDLTKDSDDDFLALRAFLRHLCLMWKYEKEPYESENYDLTTPSDLIRGFPLKKLSLCDVPFFVKVGILPKECLATKDDLQRYARFIDKNTCA